MSKKKKRHAAERSAALAVVTFRTVSIDFETRTVTIDGRRFGPIESPGFDFPILSGDAVFLPPRGMERVA